MTDDEEQGLFERLDLLFETVRAMHLTVATLRELLQTQLGVTDAQYDAAHADVVAAVQALAPDDGTTKH